MKNVSRTAFLLFVVGALPASAANFYRCKDAHGKPHYSMSMPPECEGLDTQVLNEKGNVVEVIEGEASRAKTLAREAEEAAALKARNDQLQRDRVLLETYLAVSDIERLRDQRLELLQAQLKVAEQHIGTLQERLNQLKQQSARFKPYSDAPDARPLPDHIAEALIGTIRSIAVDRETMQTKTDEQTQLAANFDRDIKRFKELKAKK